MKKMLFVLLIAVLVSSVPVPASANSAEPPAMIILSNDLPEDAVLTLETAEGEALEFRELRSSGRAWEKQFRIWLPWELKEYDGLLLRVTAGEHSFTCPLPERTAHKYRSVMTLDYSTQTLKMGQEPWRQPLLTAIRLVLTLLVEALVFYAFGFREKRTWLVFLILNLSTQGWLNTVINSNAFSGGYWVLALYFIEFVIFLGEAIAVCLVVKEQKRWKRILCTIAANAASLAAGLVLISNLPI